MKKSGFLSGYSTTWIIIWYHSNGSYLEVFGCEETRTKAPFYNRNIADLVWNDAVLIVQLDPRQISSWLSLMNGNNFLSTQGKGWQRIHCNHLSLRNGFPFSAIDFWLVCLCTRCCRYARDPCTHKQHIEIPMKNIPFACIHLWYDYIYGTHRSQQHSAEQSLWSWMVCCISVVSCLCRLYARACVSVCVCVCVKSEPRYIS